MAFLCKNCNTVVNIVLTVVTEQPSRYYRKLPKYLELDNKDKSTVKWRECGWVCPSCGNSGKDPEENCNFTAKIKKDPNESIFQ